MLIIEIALGVVLGGIILAYFDKFLALLLIAGAVLLTIGVVAGLVLLVSEFPQAIGPLIIGIGVAIMMERAKKQGTKNQKPEENTSLRGSDAGEAIR